MKKVERRTAKVLTMLVVSCLWLAQSALTAGASAPAGRYRTSTEPMGSTVFDTKTKLLWQQVASTTPSVWSASYCNSVRLPSTAERAGPLHGLSLKSGQVQR
jgi:phage tail sheath gpL-like